VSKEPIEGEAGRCPSCEETTEPEALSCPHCGGDLRVDLLLVHPPISARELYAAAKELEAFAPDASFVAIRRTLEAGHGPLLDGLSERRGSEAEKLLATHGAEARSVPHVELTPAAESRRQPSRPIPLRQVPVRQAAAAQARGPRVPARWLLAAAVAGLVLILWWLASGRL
jgi:hypothetical protein